MEDMYVLSQLRWYHRGFVFQNGQVWYQTKITIYFDRSTQNKGSTEVMIDAFAVLSTDDSQKILTHMIIRSSQPHQDFINRLMTHVSGYDFPPHQVIIGSNYLPLSNDEGLFWWGYQR